MDEETEAQEEKQPGKHSSQQAAEPGLEPTFLNAHLLPRPQLPCPHGALMVEVLGWAFYPELGSSPP